MSWKQIISYFIKAILIFLIPQHAMANILDLLQPNAATFSIVCPGKGIIAFVHYKESFTPSETCGFCKERGQYLRFSVVGSSAGDSGMVCVRHIAFNGNCFFPDACYPFVNGMSQFTIDLNEYVHSSDLCGQYFNDGFVQTHTIY